MAVKRSAAGTREFYMSLDGIKKETVLKLYEKMIKSRLVSEKIIELYPRQEMRCPVHLSLGQEAIGAGVCENLTSQDAVFSHHRNHAHYLSMGGDLKKMMAELYGKETGCCKGNGGSMHLSDSDCGFIAASSIVGGSMPIAVGAALAFKMRKEKRVAVAFFGDGAVGEGVFHESLNFAALKNLPVVFICENNFYAVLSKLEARHKNLNIFEQAAAYQIPGEAVDGNDAVAVYRAAGKAVERARRGEGPALIECRTYRWREHVGPNCDHELGHRPACEVEEWQKRCPIKKLEENLLTENIISEKEIKNIQEKISEEINEAVRFAKESPLPQEKDLLNFVYPN